MFSVISFRIKTKLRNENIYCCDVSFIQDIPESSAQTYDKAIHYRIVSKIFK